MRRKNRLVFAELESELSIIPHYQMLSILGGGNVNTIEQAVQWAQSMGIPFTVDGQNQYKDSGGNILLSPVDVHAWANDFQNPNPNPYSTTTVPEIMPTEMEIKRSYALYFESLGYEMIQNEDGTYYCASSPYQESKDPWKRDSNGNITGTKTPNTFTSFDYESKGAILILDEVILEANGLTIKVHEVDLVIDPINHINRLPTESEKSNCFGWAVADGKYWFEDNPTTSDNELNEFSKFVSAFYIECSPSEASIVVLDHGGPYHAGRVSHDSNGNIQYEAKGGVGDVNTFQSESDFRGTEYLDGQSKYYKLKN